MKNILPNFPQSSRYLEELRRLQNSGGGSALDSTMCQLKPSTKPPPPPVKSLSSLETKDIHDPVQMHAGGSHMVLVGY